MCNNNENGWWIFEALSRRFSTEDALALLSDEELFEAKIDPAERAIDLNRDNEGDCC